ncbi:MAG: hypothetical protein ACPLRS_00820, partial [Hydrogenobacter sp.]
RLYRSLGFQIVSERPRYYSDGENAYQMILHVNEFLPERVPTSGETPSPV